MKIARARPLALTAVLLGLLTACETTKLETAWHAPEVGSIKFSKIVVVCIAPVESLRRPLEDAMEAEIKAVPTVASYELLPDVADQVDPKKLNAAIAAAGVDGIITMRMVSLDDKTTYNPGYEMPVYYSSFYSYYSPAYALGPYYRGYPGSYYGAPMGYEYVPPSVTTEVIMRIETNIYNAKDGKLIWTGLSRTSNPSESANLIGEVAGVVRARMREQKLIP
jgi:hypothetical protein